MQANQSSNVKSNALIDEPLAWDAKMQRVSPVFDLHGFKSLPVLF
jgi:hypothetical protein